MKILLASADLDEIRQVKGLGLLEGVVLDPCLVQKAGEGRRDIIRRICCETDGPVCVPLTAGHSSAMLAGARDLVKIAPNIVINIPVTLDGLRAINELGKHGINVGAVLAFSANQALLAAKAGASFVSISLNRLDKAGRNGLGVLRDVLTVVRNDASPTRILAVGHYRCRSIPSNGASRHRRGRCLVFRPDADGGGFRQMIQEEFWHEIMSHNVNYVNFSVCTPERVSPLP